MSRLGELLNTLQNVHPRGPPGPPGGPPLAGGPPGSRFWTPPRGVPRVPRNTPASSPPCQGSNPDHPHQPWHKHSPSRVPAGIQQTAIVHPHARLSRRHCVGTGQLTLQCLDGWPLISLLTTSWGPSPPQLLVSRPPLRYPSVGVDTPPPSYPLRSIIVGDVLRMRTPPVGTPWPDHPRRSHLITPL